LKKVVIFPFLFILYGILNLVLNNLDQLDPILAARPLIVLLSLTIAGSILLRILFRDWQYAAYLTFLGLAFFFVSGHLVRILETWQPNDPDLARWTVIVFLGMILLIIGLKRVWKRLGGAEVVTPLLNIVLTFAIVSQLVVSLPEITSNFRSSILDGDQVTIPVTGGTIDIDCSNRPDIYYIILDGYGRADVLEELYSLDNGPFLDFLEENGFFIAEQGHSNYTQTIYSLASALNLELIGPEPQGVNGRRYFSQLIEDNEVIALLEECGYETVAFETGFSFTNHPDVDTYLGSDVGLNEFENLLIAGTPLELLAEELNWDPPDRSYRAHRERVLDVFSELSRLSEQDGPQFVFAHILSPHPPFVFDAAGNAIQPDWSYSLADGNEFPGGWEEYRRGYAGQVQFINRMLESTIEAILVNSPAPPIIILQGDHGPGGSLDWKSPDQTCLWERTSILNAYYLPGGSNQLYTSITPVNSFRVILNEYFGTNLELSPDKTYFTSHLLPRKVIDVTANRSSRDQCPNI
jgi:Sulfatase